MKIAIKRTDGGISIMHLLNDNELESSLRKWQEVHINEYVSHEIVTEADLPQDRLFRNAWGHDLKVDMDKAREIHMDKIRKARDKAMKALDVETLKGRDVQAQKQVLRDIPQTFDLSVATTPEELTELWPDGLVP